jgi:predicted permease
MIHWRRIWSKLLSLFHNDRVEDELEREIATHLALLEEEFHRKGMGPDEARLAARRAYGGVEQAKQLHRDERAWLWLEEARQDVGYGFRRLRNSPGFTTAALLTLALGIGANTAIFTVINAVMLRSIPVQSAGQLVQILDVDPSVPQGGFRHFSHPAFEYIRAHNQVFSAVFAVSGASFQTLLDAHGSGVVEQPVSGSFVSNNFFSVLGVRPVVGQTFGGEDDHVAGTKPVAVISYGLWKRSFGLDPAVVGQQFKVNSSALTIIGVAPRGFEGVEVGHPSDLWVPMTMQPTVMHGDQVNFLNNFNLNWLSLVGRLAPGISMSQARANLNVVFKEVLVANNSSAWSEKEQRDFLAQRIELDSSRNGLNTARNEVARSLFVLMAVAGLVLLIACVNVANLLLAKSSTRRKEFAIRLAIGARRMRLIRLLLTESLLLALTGGALGVLVGYWGSALLVTFLSNGGSPLILTLRPDLHILGFTAAVSVVTGILFGMAPALTARRMEPSVVLKDGARTVGTGGSSRFGLGSALVASQIALSLLLVIGAGLLVRTLLNLRHIDAGFTRENVLMFDLDPTKLGYKGIPLANLYQQMLERIETTPGVQSATISRVTPISGGGWNGSVAVEGYNPIPGEDLSVYLNSVGPRFFETLQIPFLLGRDFAATDTPASQEVAVIDETMAKHFFGSHNPLGRHFGPRQGNGGAKFEIIAVVKNSKYLDLREKLHSTAYLFCMQDMQELGGLTFEVRTQGSQNAGVSQIRDEVRAIVPGLGITGVRTLDEQVDQSLLQERLVSTLASIFSFLALLLACLGLYGLMAYTVVLKTNDIGIRMALGAARNDVVWMILREALLLTVIGICIGLPVALVSTHLLASMLFGVKPDDPVSILAAMLVMITVALFAGYLPARRASRIDPMIALRFE